MKTNTVDVSGMLSPLSARGVEKQLARLRGVKKVVVNYVAGSATVTYDEAQTDPQDHQGQGGGVRVSLRRRDGATARLCA